MSPWSDTFRDLLARCRMAGDEPLRFEVNETAAAIIREECGALPSFVFGLPVGCSLGPAVRLVSSRLVYQVGAGIEFEA